MSDAIKHECGIAFLRLRKPLEYFAGSKFILTSNKCKGNSKIAYINYENFPQDVKVGETVLINDGKLQIEVVKTNNRDKVTTKVIHGGPLRSNKGVNLPNTTISQPCLTKKDLNDLEFILTQPIEWIGLSFVRSPLKPHF